MTEIKHIDSTQCCEHGITAHSIHDWTPAEVVEESKRILSSPLFTRSLRLSRFLQTAVEYLLKGNGHLLKEYTVGVEVYDRRPSFDPAQDSIVRTEARRLRGKLGEYYAQPGSRRRVMILFVVGSYVPVIQPGTAMSTQPGVQKPAELSPESSGETSQAAIYSLRRLGSWASERQSALLEQRRRSEKNIVVELRQAGIAHPLDGAVRGQSAGGDYSVLGWDDELTKIEGDAEELHRLRAENVRLKKLVADLSLSLHREFHRPEIGVHLPAKPRTIGRA